MLETAKEFVRRRGLPEGAYYPDEIKIGDAIAEIVEAIEKIAGTALPSILLCR